jgi:hypothetical protein
VTRPRRRQAGEGGISEYRTKAGARYWAKYKVAQEDGSTKEVLKRGFLTRKAAAEYLRGELEKISHGTHVMPSKITVGEQLDQHVNGLRLAPSTLASYRKNIRLHIKPKLGSIQLTRLTTAQINVWLRDLEATGRKDHETGTGLSARMVRYCFTILKRRTPRGRQSGADRPKPCRACEAAVSEGSKGSGDQTLDCAAVGDLPQVGARAQVCRRSRMGGSSADGHATG